jgi:glycosyltransferase involved in cell wall biosynthesis
MKLGLVLSIGESFTDLKKHGQDILLRDQNIQTYSKNFEKVYIFSYTNENYPLYKNTKLITNYHKIHRYLYTLILPIIKKREYQQCDVLRGLQVTGGIPCLLAKLFYKKPFVINYGYDYEKVAKIEGKYILAFFYKIVSFIVIKFADAVIITSPHLKKKVDTYLPRRIEFIPNSVNTNLFKPSIKHRESIKNILFIGRLEEQKNLFSLIEAVSRLRNDLKLIFIGDGSKRKELTNFAKENNVNLQIIKSVPHNKLPMYLKSADVFVLPSFIEGNPKVLLEAMSTGVAAIGADVEGIKEVISDKKTGILTGTNPEQIKKAIEYLIQNPKVAKELGKKARKYVYKNYAFSKLAKKEIKLLKSFV